MHSPTTQCAVFVRLCMLMQQELAPAATSAMQHAATKYTLHLTSAEVLPRRRRTTRGTGASTRRRGSPFLLPAGQIRRVVLCAGQVYYHLSAARRARRIRDIVLVRLEQIAPFPSDLMFKARA